MNSERKAERKFIAYLLGSAEWICHRPFGLTWKGMASRKREPYIRSAFCRGRARRVPVFVCTCILSLVFAPASPALDASERVFIWDEANAQMQNARTPPEYLRAAAVYQRLVDDGVRNGVLFYNMGTALLLAGRDEQAFNALERAERYLGRRADNNQNLKIAFAKKTKSQTAILPWCRIAAFWHFYLSCPQRTAIASGAFLVFWLALALKYALRFTTGLVLRRMGVRQMTNTLILISLFVFVVFASSVAASWQMESSAGRYQINFQPPPPPTNAPPVLK